MDRRIFVSGLLMGGIDIISAGRSFAQVASPTILRLGLASGRLSSNGQFAAVFAEETYRRSGGRLLIDVCFSGQAGGELDLVQDMTAGAIDLVVASSVGYAAKSVAPSLGIFDIPFLFRDVPHARRVLDGPIGQSSLKAVEASGVVGLVWGENGLRHITTAALAVRQPSDLAGLKIRVPQSDVMMRGFKTLGAVPTPIPFPELYASLAAGTVDAQENPVGNIRDAAFDEVQKFLCLTGHVYSPSMMMMGRRRFEALPPSDQILLRQAAMAGAAASRATSDTKSQSDIEELRRRGMTIVDDVNRHSFTEASLFVQKDLATLFGQDAIEAIRNFGAA